MVALVFLLSCNHQLYINLAPKNEKVFQKKIIKKKVNGSKLNVLVAIVQPITGGSAPAAPPITMFCGVFFFNQIV